MPTPENESNLERLRGMLVELERHRKQPDNLPALPDVVQRWFDILINSTERIRDLAMRLVSLEEDLERERGHMLAVMRTAIAAIIWMDADGRVGHWNPAAERLFGWTADEATGRLLADLIIPERYRARHAAGLRAFVASGETSPVFFRTMHVPALRKDGGEFVVQMTVGLTRDRDAYRFFAFLRDPVETQPCPTLEEMLHTLGRDG